jgi:hypothetical protein
MRQIKTFFIPFTSSPFNKTFTVVDCIGRRFGFECWQKHHKLCLFNQTRDERSRPEVGLEKRVSCEFQFIFVFPFLQHRSFTGLQVWRFDEHAYEIDFGSLSRICRFNLFIIIVVIGTWQWQQQLSRRMLVTLPLCGSND